MVAGCLFNETLMNTKGGRIEQVSLEMSLKNMQSQLAFFKEWRASLSEEAINDDNNFISDVTYSNVLTGITGFFDVVQVRNYVPVAHSNSGVIELLDTQAGWVQQLWCTLS